MESNETEVIARQFLHTGLIGEATEESVAAACERLVQQVFRASVRRALQLARRFQTRAQAHGGRTLRQTAWRSLGRMHHFSGRHAEALRCYLEARQLCQHEPLVRARIDRTLIDIYMYLGDYNAAMKHGRAAVRVFTTLEAHSDLAQTRVNLGNLYHRQDKPQEADQLYVVAARFFEANQNRVALARTWYNRANVLVQLFQMEEAEALYRNAMAIYVESGYELDACDARYGLAWLNLLTGRFHQALVDLTACESTYQSAGDPRGVALCLLDRAEVFLQLGLYTDAADLAARAVLRFKSLRLEYELARAQLFRAYALAGCRQSERARRELEKAERGFASLRHTGYIGAAHLLRADVGEESSGSRRRELQAARRCFDRAALFFWQALCDLKMAELSGRASAYAPRLRPNPAVQCVPHLYAAWQVLEGDGHAAAGQREDALECWRKAADRLDLVRAALPPMELRNRYARGTASPHARLVEAYFGDAPMLAAIWSERSTTAGIWNTGAPTATFLAARQKVRRSLEALSTRVHSLSQELMIPAHRSAGSNSILPSAARLAYLRRQIRECLLAIDHARDDDTLSARLLADCLTNASRDYPIVQFQGSAGDLLAFVHTQGKVTARRFENGLERIERLNERWRFCVERLLLRGTVAGCPDMALERSIWRELGDWLWAGLEISDSCEQVVIVPQGQLANIPWQALEYRGVRLGEKHTIVLAPSFRHHRFARSRPCPGTRILLFRGAGADLASANDELMRLLALAPGESTLHAPATRAVWPEEGDFFLWHYAGHARLVTENPFYSYLPLEDGPIFAADFQVRTCQVGLATLAACRSGEEVALPGEESTGFVRALLEMGAKNVLASRWPVMDQSTALYMERFYAELFDKNSLSLSMQRAEYATRQKYPSAYHWAAFALYGAGTLGGSYAKES